MGDTLLKGVEMPTPASARGLLTVALPAPDGWGQGLSIPFYGCGEPQLQNRCVDANDAPHRTAVAEFLPFGITQGAACSTLSRIDQEAHAQGRLDSTTEWAVARQLATDGLGLSTPSFEDGTSLGTVANADFVLALATLEQAAADAGFGTQWWLHAPIKAAAYLGNLDLLNGRWAPSGAPWIISPGYPVEGATTIRLWATGPVWASVDDPFILHDVDWTVNTDEAYAQRNAIVAFDPCVNLYIDVTVPASPDESQ